MSEGLAFRPFEDYLAVTGWGIYSKYLLGLTCACNFMCAATLLTIPFAISISGCDYNVPHFIVLSIYIFYLNGRNFGGFAMACMCDRYGRKRELMYSILTIFIATFISAFAYNYYILMGTSFFLGLGLEGTTYTMKILFVETVPYRKRGFYIFFSNIFWSLGYLAMSVFAIFMEHSYYGGYTKRPGMYLSTWRIMYAVCGGLSLIVACACAILEESARHFLSVGKTRIGHLVLKQFFAINKSSYAENFEVKEDDVKRVIKTYDLNYEEPDEYLAALWLFLKRTIKSLRLLLSRPFLRIIVLLMILKIPFLIFGSLEMNIILAKHLDDSAKSNTTLSGLDYVYHMPPNNTYRCTLSDKSITFFKNYLKIAPNLIFGDILGMVLVDRFGRRFLLFTGALLGGVFLLSSGFLENGILRMQSSSLVMIFHSCVSSTLNVVCLESVPTVIRGTALAFTNLLGFFLAMFAVCLVEIRKETFNVIMGAALCCVSILSCLFRELAKKPMVE